MYNTRPDITKEYVLRRITEEEIFEFYLGITVKYGELFCSPLRTDKNPTCSFAKLPSGTVYYRDWSEDRGMDCFNLVSKLYNLNFKQTVERIYVDMLNGKKPDPIYDYTPKKQEVKSKRNIKVAFSKWHPEQIAYLKQYHITSEVAKQFNIFPIDVLYLDGKINYRYNSYDPAIAYYFGNNGNEQRWKIYFFKRKTGIRFICNTNRINGWIQLPEKAENLVITKSLKDVACLSLFNIPAISMQNETTMPYDYIIDELKHRFSNIYSLYDYDKTGIHLANRLQEEYKINPLFFKNVEGIKDFSDYLKINGKQKTQRLINYVTSYLESNQKDVF